MNQSMKSIKRTKEVVELNKQSIDNQFESGVIGIDEVGRGALAGPIVAAAVFFEKNPDIYGIKDSKKLSEKQRQCLFERIIKVSKWAACLSSVEEINKLNIREATHLAMLRAVLKLDYSDKVILVDGNANPFNQPQLSDKTRCIVGGDMKSLAIASASIVAKVIRDEIMLLLGKEFPHYSWLKNKGYGTFEHINAIKKFGSVKYHRSLFLRKII